MLDLNDREAMIDYIVDTLVDDLDAMTEAEQIRAIRAMLRSDLERWRKMGRILASVVTLADGRTIANVLGVTEIEP